MVKESFKWGGATVLQKAYIRLIIMVSLGVYKLYVKLIEGKLLTWKFLRFRVMSRLVMLSVRCSGLYPLKSGHRRVGLSQLHLHCNLRLSFPLKHPP